MSRYSWLPGALVFFGVIVVAGCALHKGKAKEIPLGTWQATPIIIDGDSNDWPSPYPNYDAKAMVAYATSNDRKNLYFTLESGDEMTQLKIVQRGVTVSIDTSGGKEPSFSINYPLESDDEQVEVPRKEDFQQDNNSRYVKRQMPEKIKKGAERANQYALEGFGACSGGYVVSKTAPCGIKVIAKIDAWGELVWEAVVPFRAIFGIDSITPAWSGKPVSICFEVKSFKYPKSKTGGSDNANASSMNNGMGSGGMGGGRNAALGGTNGVRNSENPLQQLYEHTKTWKQFGLAYK